MRCWRFDLQRSFSLYLNNELAPDRIKRIEDHLLDCGTCRDQLIHLRTGHRLAAQMPRLMPARDPWDAIEAAIDREAVSGSRERQTATRTFLNGSLVATWRKRLLSPAFALGVVAIVMTVLLLVQSRSAHRYASSEQEIGGLASFEAIDRGEFHAVSISNIESNTKPHVVAEGYVSEVRVNDEDGDLSFKLVDNLQAGGPFIICEIIDPIKLTPPAVGSRVRVYGVSRYDGQDNHNWYEVHPVLNIEVMR
jgi:hypothetical protein